MYFKAHLGSHYVASLPLLSILQHHWVNLIVFMTGMMKIVPKMDEIPHFIHFFWHVSVYLLCLFHSCWLILFHLTLWKLLLKFALQLDGSTISPFPSSSLPLSLLSSHSACLIRSVISPHSGWCLLIWQHYCLLARCCCLYCLLSLLTNSSKEKEREWEKIAANHAVLHNWLCKPGRVSLCLQIVHEMCVCLCNSAHISFVLPLTRWDDPLSHWVLCASVRIEV